MKTLLFLLCSMALLVSCEGFRERLTSPENQREVVRQIDTNNDNNVSQGELAAAMKNPLLWITILNLLLGGGAAASAYVANKNAGVAKKSTDELWDATHAPIAKPPTTTT